MLRHQLLSEQKILIVEPLDELEASDFTTVATEIDPWIDEHGALRGVLIDAPEFPGWHDFAALVEHFRFVREHHR